VRLAAAALLAALTMAACGGSGDSRPMSVEQASREAPEDTVVAVTGTLVHAYGNAMLCSSLLDDEESERCGSPSLWVEGPLDATGWQGYSPVQWKKSVTLHGVVDEGVLTLSR
jgi:hypothetical protein